MLGRGRVHLRTNCALNFSNRKSNAHLISWQCAARANAIVYVLAGTLGCCNITRMFNVRRKWFHECKYTMWVGQARSSEVVQPSVISAKCALHIHTSSFLNAQHSCPLSREQQLWDHCFSLASMYMLLHWEKGHCSLLIALPSNYLANSLPTHSPLALIDCFTKWPRERDSTLELFRALRTHFIDSLRSK